MEYGYCGVSGVLKVRRSILWYSGEAEKESRSLNISDSVRLYLSLNISDSVRLYFQATHPG